MKFGKTWQEKRQILKNKKKIFAWLPVQLNDRNWAWLEHVRVDYHIPESDYYNILDQLDRKPTYYPIE